MRSADDEKAFQDAAAVVARRLMAGLTPAEATEELARSGVAADLAAEIVGHASENLHRFREADRQAESNRPEDVIILNERFPDLQPIQGAPSLFTVNGIGLGLYGSRDRDDLTNSHIKTHCFCIVFIPVVAIGAYRVINAPSGGWYFLGKERLSGFAKGWNILLLLAIFAAIASGLASHHFNSPEYKARQSLERGEAAMNEGDLVKAARHFSEAARSHTAHSAPAVAKFNELIQRLPDSDLAADARLTIFTDAVAVQRSRGGMDGTFGVARKLVAQTAKTSPREAIRLLHAVDVLDPAAATDEAIRILNSPEARPAPVATNDLFRIAMEIVIQPEQKPKVFDAAAPHVARLADADLNSAVSLLALVVPLGESDRIAETLKTTLDGRAEKAPLDSLRSLIEMAWPVFDSNSKVVLATAGLSALEKNRTLSPRERLVFLGVFNPLDDKTTPAIDAARRKSLEEVVAAEKDDLEAAIELCLILEREANSERIETLLTPFRDRLGDTEGTRLLGQALVRNDKFEESYALLNPYVEKRLGALHGVEQQYETQLQQLQQRVIDELKSGRAVGFNFQLASTAGDAIQQQMVRDYMVQRMKNAPDLAATNEELSRKSAVVPVALDLGIVTLRRAQKMTNAEERKKELERAEKTFLAIRGAAGESDKYRMFLGQVYYWLGKPDEGRELFDELLESQNRGYQILMQIAYLLRDLGAVRESRELIEEAYKKTADAQEKFYAAHLRSMTSVKLEDRIEWLKKADPNSESVKADLASSLGQQAEGQNEMEKAAGHFREAVRIYDAQPESSMSLNNGALGWIQIFMLTGERSSIERAIQRLERARTFSPSDPIVLLNLGNSQLRAAIHDVCGPELSLHRLKANGSMSAAAALYRDSAGREAIRKRVRENALWKRAQDNLEKAQVLSPRRIELYASLLEGPSFLDDAKAIQQIAERVAAAEIDHRDLKDYTLKYYSELDEETLQRKRLNIEYYQKLIDDFRRENRKADFAVAVGRLINLKVDVEFELNSETSDEMVKLAEESHALHPSRQSEQNISDARAFRACVTLAKDFPEFADDWRAAFRMLSGEMLLATVLNQQGALGDAAIANADAVRVVELRSKSCREFPDRRDAVGWALLKRLRPDEAAEIVRILPESTSLSESWNVFRLTSPLSVPGAVDEYWRRLALGKENEAIEVMHELREEGVEFPMRLLQRPMP